MIYLFHPEAESEFNDSVAYNDFQEKNLGLDFSKRYIPPFKESSNIRMLGQKSPTNVRDASPSGFPLESYIRLKRIVFLS